MNLAFGLPQVWQISYVVSRILVNLCKNSLIVCVPFFSRSNSVIPRRCGNSIEWCKFFLHPSLTTPTSYLDASHPCYPGINADIDWWWRPSMEHGLENCHQYLLLYKSYSVTCENSSRRPLDGDLYIYITFIGSVRKVACSDAGTRSS